MGERFHGSKVRVIQVKLRVGLGDGGVVVGRFKSQTQFIFEYEN